MTADELTFTLERWLTGKGADVVIPNVVALGAHESDVLVATRRRYLHEIELKLTIADYRADHRGRPLTPKWARQEVMRAAAEGRPVPAAWRNPWLYREPTANPEPIVDPDEARRAWRNLEARLAPTCPNRYSYAYPEELGDRLDAEVPAWAGIIHLHTRHGDRWPTQVRRPALLHKADAPEAVLEKMWRSAYARFWTERRRRLEASQTIDALRQRLERLDRIHADQATPRHLEADA